MKTITVAAIILAAAMPASAMADCTVSGQLYPGVSDQDCVKIAREGF